MNMKILKNRSLWSEHKLWILTAAGAAVAVTAGYLGRHKIAEGINKVRDNSETDSSHENGSRLKSALRWSALTGAAAGVGKLLSRNKTAEQTEATESAISTDEPAPEPIDISRAG